METQTHFQHFADLLGSFSAVQPLRDRVLDVLLSLPADVQEDFVADITFSIRLEQVTQGRSTMHFMACPQGRGVSRCVILRVKLCDAPEPFAKYVIAHELAHAFLRNGGWGAIEDRELAADALAASWGFPRPSR